MFSRKQDIMYREEATSAQNTINRGNVNNKFIDYVLFYFILFIRNPIMGEEGNE